MPLLAEPMFQRLDVGDQPNLCRAEADALVKAPGRPILGCHTAGHKGSTAVAQFGDHRTNERPRDCPPARLGPDVKLGQIGDTPALHDGAREPEYLAALLRNHCRAGAHRFVNPGPRALPRAFHPRRNGRFLLHPFVPERVERLAVVCCCAAEIQRPMCVFVIAVN
jgi:hypothetical protein